MNTVGKTIKEARLAKRLSLANLEAKTKIKKEFAMAIEEGNWEALPEFPVVSGFVKNIARAVGISQEKALALLRRDYPPKNLSINPKPDVGDKFVWSPKLTFITGVAIILVLILGYLGYQYKKFISPPSLSVVEPVQDQVIKQRKVKVSGRTDPDATVKVNNQPVLTNEEGNFSVEIEIYEGTGEIEIKVTSRTGRETTVRRKINPEFN